MQYNILYYYVVECCCCFLAGLLLFIKELKHTFICLFFLFFFFLAMFCISCQPSLPFYSLENLYLYLILYFFSRLTHFDRVYVYHKWSDPLKHHHKRTACCVTNSCFRLCFCSPCSLLAGLNFVFLGAGVADGLVLFTYTQHARSVSLSVL